MDRGIKRVLFTSAVLGSITSPGDAQDNTASSLQLWDMALNREQTLQSVFLSALVFKNIKIYFVFLSAGIRDDPATYQKLPGQPFCPSAGRQDRCFKKLHVLG